MINKYVKTIPKTPKEVFQSDPDITGAKEYFAKTFPEMPEPKDIGEYGQALAWMTDIGFIYYIEFFLSLLEEDPLDKSVLFDYMSYRLNRQKDHLDEEIFTRFSAIESIRFSE